MYACPRSNRTSAQNPAPESRAPHTPNSPDRRSAGSARPANNAYWMRSNRTYRQRGSPHHPRDPATTPDSERSQPAATASVVHRPSRHPLMPARRRSTRRTSAGGSCACATAADGWTNHGQWREGGDSVTRRGAWAPRCVPTTPLLKSRNAHQRHALAIVDDMDRAGAQAQDQLRSWHAVRILVHFRVVSRIFRLWTTLTTLNHSVSSGVLAGIVPSSLDVLLWTKTGPVPFNGGGARDAVPPSRLAFTRETAAAAYFTRGRLALAVPSVCDCGARAVPAPSIVRQRARCFRNRFAGRGGGRSKATHPDNPLGLVALEPRAFRHRDGERFAFRVRRNEAEGNRPPHPSGCCTAPRDAASHCVKSKQRGGCTRRLRRAGIQDRFRAALAVRRSRRVARQAEAQGRGGAATDGQKARARTRRCPVTPAASG